MKRRVAIAALALLTACVPKVTDPHAIAPRYDRWEATLPAPKAAVYGAAMRILSDSSYTTTTASLDGGIIQTAPRKDSEVQRGGAQLRSMLTGDNPVKVNLVLTPVGNDSTRVAISGQYAIGDNWTRVDARVGEWANIRGIGEALVAAVPGASTTPR